MPFCSLEAYIAVSQTILNRNAEPDLYAKPTTSSIRNWTYILFRQKPEKADGCGGRDLNSRGFPSRDQRLSSLEHGRPPS